MDIRIETATPRLLAAIRRPVRVGEIGRVAMPVLGRVWEHVRAHPGLHDGGHNVFLYRHPTRRDDPMECAFGVEVTRAFAADGEVEPVATPGGEVVTATHVGPYDTLKVTHDAIHAWAEQNGRAFAGWSWEVYGDWSDDPAHLRTNVYYLLADDD